MNINTSKETQFMIKELINDYAVYCDEEQRYIVETNNARFDVLSRISASILLDDPALAAEATSNDNPWYQRIMMPSLISHFKDVTDKDKLNKFIEDWHFGIYKYLENHILLLIEKELEDFNDAKKYEKDADQ